MTMRAEPSPQMVSQARKSSPVNVPSTRGRRNVPVIEPSNSPRPPDATGVVREPQARAARVPVPPPSPPDAAGRLGGAEVGQVSGEDRVPLLPVLAHDMKPEL